MHTPFMIAALEQARLGRGVCAPNPSVGAVVVSDNEIIAKAWHQGAGKEHAEQLVLQSLDSPLNSARLYVTLEPCNHWGRTPPCVDAIIESGIKTVIYGFPDPNPIVMANNTPEILKEEGIEVIYWPLAEIDHFYKSYQFWMRTRRPWVTAKIAQSLDGKIAGKDGERIILSNELCAKFTHEQRQVTDVILTSSRTIMNDDPLLSVRLTENEKKKTVAIIDRNLSLPKEAKVFSKAERCHIFYDKTLKVSETIDNCFYHPITEKDKKLDLNEILKQLGKLGFHDVWVEAGGTLFSELHNKKLVNTTYIYLAPKILGEEAKAAYNYKDFFDNSYRLSWQTQADNIIAQIEWGKDVH